MPKLFRILGLAGLCVLLLAGTSFATAIFEVGGVHWASLYVETDTDGTENILRYTLVNDGPFEAEIHLLEIPYIPDMGISYSQLDNGGVMSDFIDEDAAGGFLVFNYFGGVLQDQRAWTVEVRGELGITDGTFRITNSGHSDETDADALLTSLGGGPGGDPVPEPATLLLLGAGLFGVGAAGYLRRRRTR